MPLLGGLDISKLNFGQYPPSEVFMQYVLEGIADMYPLFARALTMLEDILSDQDTLNADVARLVAVNTRLVAANTAVAAGIADLKAQVAAGTPAAALDFSGLESALTDAESGATGDEANEPVAAAPPVDGGSTTPPVDGSGDATQTATVTAS